MTRTTISLLAAAMMASSARAEPIVMRIATAAPDGTEWSREGRSHQHDLEELTHGQVRLKMYYSGVAGDEMTMLERVRREQLDGIVSGGMVCQRVAPTMRALRVVGLYHSRDESAYVSGRLKETLDEEMRKAGFVNLGEIGVGPDVIFSRTPVASMADLRKTRLWIWNLDDVFDQTLTAMGLHVVPRPLEHAAGEYARKKLDGFIAVPMAALAFQWSTEARYYSDLRQSFLRGCYIVASRAFDQLSAEQQRAFRQSAALTITRLDDIARRQDEALLGELFERQGLKRVPVTDRFAAEFLALADEARTRLSERLVPRPLLQRVQALLAEYRAQHHQGETAR